MRYHFGNAQKRQGGQNSKHYVGDQNVSPSPSNVSWDIRTIRAKQTRSYL